MHNQRNREHRSHTSDDRTIRSSRDAFRQGRPGPEGRWQNIDDEMGGERFDFERGPSYNTTAERYGHERLEHGPEYNGPGRFERDSDIYPGDRANFDEPRRLGASRGSYSSGYTGYSGGQAPGTFNGAITGWRSEENRGFSADQDSWKNRNMGSPRTRDFSSTSNTYGNMRSSDLGGSYAGSEYRNASKGQQREFIGKGPKGYTRSDDRIREEVCERLAEGYLDASDIEVSVLNGEVTLSGMVCDRQSKRLAEEIVESAIGVLDVENKLKVKAKGMDTGLMSNQMGRNQDLSTSVPSGKNELKHEGTNGISRENSSTRESGTATSSNRRAHA